MNRQAIQHFLRTQSFGSGKALTTMALAMRKGGIPIRLSTPAPKRWPRVRGPRATRIDMTSGSAVGFIG